MSARGRPPGPAAKGAAPPSGGAATPGRLHTVLLDGSLFDAPPPAARPRSEAPSSGRPAVKRASAKPAGGAGAGSGSRSAAPRTALAGAVLLDKGECECGSRLSGELTETCLLRSSAYPRLLFPALLISHPPRHPLHSRGRLHCHATHSLHTQWHRRVLFPAVPAAPRRSPPGCCRQRRGRRCRRAAASRQRQRPGGPGGRAVARARGRAGAGAGAGARDRAVCSGACSQRSPPQLTAAHSSPPLIFTHTRPLPLLCRTSGWRRWRTRWRHGRPSARHTWCTAWRPAPPPRSRSIAGAAGPRPRAGSCQHQANTCGLNTPAAVLHSLTCRTQAAAARARQLAAQRVQQLPVLHAARAAAKPPSTLSALQRRAAEPPLQHLTAWWRLHSWSLPT